MLLADCVFAKLRYISLIVLIGYGPETSVTIPSGDMGDTQKHWQGTKEVPMPWRAASPMDQRTQFIADFLRDALSITELCALYGVARKTGYKWIDRYLRHGPAGQRGGLAAAAALAE